MEKCSPDAKVWIQRQLKHAEGIDMSVNSNFRKDKCWSCEFYCGQRYYKKGLLLGDSVETDSQGACSNKRSSNCGKIVRESDWCGKYQKWSLLQSALAKQEQEYEQQLQAQWQRTEKRKEQKRLEAEKRAEQDSSLADERGVQREKAKDGKKRKHKIILISVISVAVVIAIIAGAFCISAAIKNSERHKAFVSSGGQQIVDYIQAQSKGEDSCEFAFEYGGISYSMEIEYREDYYDEFGSPALFGKGAYSFYASVKSFGGGEPYTYCTGKAVFNWQGLKNLDEISLIGTVQYQSNLVYNYYHDYQKGTACPEIIYKNVSQGNGYDLDESQIDESVTYGWKMCEIVMIGLNQLSDQVLGHNLW